jgi:hypothetical protein
MAWIEGARGIFRLHDSDDWCGSLIPLSDVAEILHVEPSALASLPRHPFDGEILLNELDVHRAFGTGRIAGAPPHRDGAARISFDELIVKRLVELTLSGSAVEQQVPCDRLKIDLAVRWKGRRVLIEFVGPSHFLPDYDRQPTSPLVRKARIEDRMGDECVIWPFWIQRAATNVRALFDPSVRGKAAVWSTKALFADFSLEDTEAVIVSASERFGACDEGLGYMYGSERTRHKPEHPVVARIRAGRESLRRLIPNNAYRDAAFWVPATPAS